jgi:hypothetical protein
MGEYIGRIYDEVKRRPKYIIHKQIDGVVLDSPRDATRGDVVVTVAAEDTASAASGSARSPRMHGGT